MSLGISSVEDFAESSQQMLRLLDILLDDGYDPTQANKSMTVERSFEQFQITSRVPTMAAALRLRDPEQLGAERHSIGKQEA